MYIEVFKERPIKPMHDNYLSIRLDKYILPAIRQNKKLKIYIQGGKIAIEDPKRWLDTGRRIEQIHKIPNKPMVLICNYVKEEDNRQQKLTLF